MFYSLLLEGLRMVRAAGFDAGIVTNGYWETSVEDGLHWLRPIRDVGIVDLSVSDDKFHQLDKDDQKAKFAREGAERLGIPTGTICIEPPSVSSRTAEEHLGKPVVGAASCLRDVRQKAYGWASVTRCEGTPNVPARGIAQSGAGSLDA